MRVVALLVIHVSLVAVSACKSTDIARPSAGTQFVAARDSFFAPGTITIDRGSPVRWTNQGTVYHTVVADSAAWFDSGLISPQYWFEVRFATPGTYLYHCSRHADMTGTIIVQ